MIELIDRDLSWLRGVHQPDDHLPSVTQLLKTQNKQGQVFIDEPHCLAVGPDIAIVHKGALPSEMLLNLPSGEVAAWSVLSFFETAELHPVPGTLMTADGLRRWCDVPAPTRSRCPRCNGRRIDPEDSWRDGMVLACQECDGFGFVESQDGLTTIGPVTVDRRALQPVAKYLGGELIAFGVAPSLDGEGLDLHIRQGTQLGVKYTRRAGEVIGWGDWRIVLSGVA